MDWKESTINWLQRSNEMYPEDNFAELWLPEYLVLDDNIQDNMFMPKKYVIAGNTSGNIELPRIIGGHLKSSYTINYCQGAYRLQTANKFAYPMIYNPVREC